jgi:hypothetical protein
MTRSSTGSIHVLTTIPHDREARTSIVTMTEVILTEETEHVDTSDLVDRGYGDSSGNLWWVTSPGHLRLHRPFLCRSWPLQVLGRSMIDLHSIIIEGSGVTVPLDYVPVDIYQDRRVWAAPVTEEGHDGQGNGP